MGSEQPHIAIVDDDRSVRKALQRLLATAGFDADAYPSGETFLDSLRDRIPDCLLLDLKMPGLSGAEVQQRLHSSGVRIPTIILSAHDDAETRKECLAAGAQRFLAKPLEGQELLAAVDRIVVGCAPFSGSRKNRGAGRH
jgi:FixJ family two-component response regulator